MKCLYCNTIIDGKYVEDRYGNVCCASHIDNNEVGVCGECLKLVPIQGNKLPDGRIICPDCMKIAVTPSRPYDWIEKQVLARLQNWGFGDLDMSRITIWTATSKEMAMYRKKDINVFNEGFCRLFPETMKVDLFVESHLTKIHFAGVLAHELLHAWNFQNLIINIPDEWSEGMCNLSSYLTYKSIDFPLARIYEENMMKDPDPIYGDGFRMVLDFYNRYGWDGIRQHIQQYKI